MAKVGDVVKFRGTTYKIVEGEADYGEPTYHSNGYYHKLEPMYRVECKKPPLGVAPRWIREEQRIAELSEAIVRYAEANKEIPEEWTKEYNELIARNKDSE